MTGSFSSKSRIFYILLGAGVSFIVIGSASALYTLTPIPVSLNGTVEAGQSDFTAESDGQYLISIENLGSTDLSIVGSAFTKGSQIALGGQLMLIVTGIIVLGLGLRAKLR